MHSGKNMLKQLTMAATMAVALSASVHAKALKCVAFGWEYSLISMRDLVGYVDELDKTPIDGVGIYLNEESKNGAWASTHTIMHLPWKKEIFEELIPTARELTSHRSMRESFIHTFRAPSRHRLGWTDDAKWGLVASNMTLAAWFAKQGGFRGLSMDPEDYHNQEQFIRRAGEPPYDELVPLARRRGQEVFRDVFREFPDVHLLGFWMLSLRQTYLGSDDPLRDAREMGDLWPAFVDGIFDVLPETAKIVDGCEDSYRYEAERGDYYRAAWQMRGTLVRLLSPENRAKYLNSLSVSFGFYMDRYVAPKDSNWYAEPVNGSALGHFEQNFAQAADAADEYIWFWGESNCWGLWTSDCHQKKDKRAISHVTWEERLPGLFDVMMATKAPYRFAAKRMKEEQIGKDRPVPLNANVECRSASEVVPAPYEAWQSRHFRNGRLYCDLTEGDGDSQSLCAEGVGNGAFSLEIKDGVRSGQRYLIMLSAKGDIHGTDVAWKRDGKWIHGTHPPVQVRFGEEQNGWRRGRAVIRVPEGADGFVVRMMMWQNPGEKCHFDNVRVIPLL